MGQRDHLSVAAAAAPSPVGHQPEAAIRRDEAQRPVVVKSAKSNAWMQADVLQQAGVDEGQGEVGHAGQLDEAVDAAGHVGHDHVARPVHDGVQLLDHVKVGLVVGVADPDAAPGDVGQLAGGQAGGHVRVLAAHGVRDRAEQGGRPDQLLEDVGLRGQGNPLSSISSSSWGWCRNQLSRHHIILDDGLRDVLKVILDNVGDAVQEFDDKQGWHLTAAHGNKAQAAELPQLRLSSRCCDPPAVNGRASRLDEFLHTNHQPPQPQPRMQSRSLDRITRYAQPRPTRFVPTEAPVSFLDSRGSLRRQQQKQQPQGFAFSSPTCADSIMTRSLPPPSAVAMATTLGDLFLDRPPPAWPHFESLNSRLRSLMAARQAELERDRAYLLKCQVSNESVRSPPHPPLSIEAIFNPPHPVTMETSTLMTTSLHSDLSTGTAKRTIDSLATPKAFKVKLQDFDGGSPDGVRPNPANCPAEPAAAVPPPAAATAAKKPRSLLGRLARMKTRSAAAGSQQPPAKADFDGAEETPAATAAEAPVEAPAAPSSSAAAPLAAIRKFLNRLPRRTKRRRRFDIGEPQLLEAQQPAAAEIPAARPDHPDLGAGGEAGNRLGTRAPPPSSQVVTFAESSLPKRLAGFSGASVTAAAPNSSASAVSTSAAAPAPELLQRLSQVENEAGFWGSVVREFWSILSAASSPVAAQPTGPAEDSDGIASPSATADAEEAGAPVALRSGGANAARKLNGQKRSLAARKVGVRIRAAMG
uniref:Protein kinase domain-containing protein n=1 Tax=Macrostomum lignano TaxID=282301 RepID=A0A1I8F2P3_9PLAT